MYERFVFSVFLLFSFSIRFGINVEGISSDGDSRLLRCMKLKTQIGRKHPDSMPPYFNCSITKTSYIQDTVHVGTKLRNKLLQPSALLPMGTQQVSITHLKILINDVPKDEHGLVFKDICPDDRQNFGSLRKMTELRVLKSLQNHVPESEATVMYLKLCHNITSSFLDMSLAPTERILRMWSSIFFLRIWRLWISETGTGAKKSQSNDYIVKNNFISPNAYECIEMNGHGLLQLIIKFRDEGKPEQFLPVLFSSQACESTFRQFRSMATIYWTKINMTLLEIFNAVGRVELQNDIRFSKIPDVKFARTNIDMPQQISHDLPLNEEMCETIKLARDEAIKDATNFGMNISSNDTLACQLIPSVSRAVKPRGNVTAPLSLNDQLCDDVNRMQLQDSPKPTTHNPTTIRADLKLRDYTDQNIILNELSPFTQVTDKHGNSKVVRKSSIVWLLTTSKNKLSSDRLRCVQSKCIENANRSTASVSSTLEANMENSVVWKAEELNVGDWCFFTHECKNRSAYSVSKSFKKIRVGLVVAFKYIIGNNLKEKQYSWDNAPVRSNLKPSERRGIHVLATWYTYNENGSLDVLNAEKKHLFLDMEDYVATTRAIKRSSLGVLRIDVDSDHLCHFNQQLLYLTGMIQYFNI